MASNLFSIQYFTVTPAPIVYPIKPINETGVTVKWKNTYPINTKQLDNYTGYV